MDQTRTNIKVHLRGGIAYAQLGGGVLTPESLLRVRDATAAALCGRRPLVFVADFRSQVFALGAGHLDEHLDGADSALFAPAAMVVPEAYVKMCRAHAWNAAQIGILRKVFTRLDEAEQWARLRAQIQLRARIAQ